MGAIPYTLQDNVMLEYLCCLADINSWENLKQFPLRFSASLDHFPHSQKGDKNLSPVYLIGHLRKFHAVMFAKVLVNFKSL